MELSEEAQAIVRGMIRLNPRERMTIPQILGHSWLKETNEDDSEEEDEDNKQGPAGNANGAQEPNNSAVEGGVGQPPA